MRRLFLCQKLCYTLLMVSIFPDILNYGFLATGILRATLGIIFIYFAYEKFFLERRERIAFFEKLKLRPAKVFFGLVTGLEFIAGLGLLLGFYMQVAALITGGLMTLATFIKWHKPSALPKNTVEFYIILAVTSFALIAMGPGAFAFDLPV